MRRETRRNTQTGTCRAFRIRRRPRSQGFGGLQGRNGSKTTRPHAFEAGLHAPSLTHSGTVALGPFNTPLDTTTDGYFRIPADMPTLDPAGSCRVGGLGAAGAAVPRDPFGTVSAQHPRAPAAPVEEDIAGGPPRRFFMA